MPGTPSLSRCGVCGEFNAGKVVETKAANFHQACFFCQGCSESLTSSVMGMSLRLPFQVVRNKPYCERCGKIAFMGKTNFAKPQKDVLWEKKAQEAREDAARQQREREQRRAAFSSTPAPNVGSGWQQRQDEEQKQTAEARERRNQLRQKLSELDAPVTPAEAPASVPFKFCTQCGHKLESAAGFCIECGTKQADAVQQHNKVDSARVATKKMEEEEGKQKQVELQEQERERKEEEKKKTEEDQKKKEEEDRAQRQLEEERERSELERPAERPAEPATESGLKAENSVCDSCAQSLTKAGATFCTKCGARQGRVVSEVKQEGAEPSADNVADSYEERQRRRDEERARRAQQREEERQKWEEERAARRNRT